MKITESTIRTNLLCGQLVSNHLVIHAEFRKKKVVNLDECKVFYVPSNALIAKMERLLNKETYLENKITQ